LNLDHFLSLYIYCVATMPRLVKVKSLEAAIALAIEDRDIQALDQLLDELITASKHEPQAAFAPALQFKPAAHYWKIPQEEGVVGDIAVATANKINRAGDELAQMLRETEYKYGLAGGIGFYPDKRFIHIDTRGREANW
jgi:hypothetical protein